MDSGYIKLWRRIQSDELWLSEPFTRGQAWIDMLILANHKDGHIRIRGILVDVPRGCMAWSERNLAARWRWSRGKVRRFFGELKLTEKIVPLKTDVNNLIQIKNYNEYQMNSTTDGTTNGTGTRRERKHIGEIPYPEWLNMEDWKRFKQYRREIKKPLSVQGEKVNLTKLTQLREMGNDPTMVIDQTIACNWAGLFEVKDKTKPTRKVYCD